MKTTDLGPVLHSDHSPIVEEGSEFSPRRGVSIQPMPTPWSSARRPYVVKGSVESCSDLSRQMLRDGVAAPRRHQWWRSPGSPCLRALASGIADGGSSRKRSHRGRQMPGWPLCHLGRLGVGNDSTLAHPLGWVSRPSLDPARRNRVSIQPVLTNMRSPRRGPSLVSLILDICCREPPGPSDLHPRRD